MNMNELKTIFLYWLIFENMINPFRQNCTASRAVACWHCSQSRTNAILLTSLLLFYLEMFSFLEFAQEKVWSLDVFIQGKKFCKSVRIRGCVIKTECALLATFTVYLLLNMCRSRVRLSSLRTSLSLCKEMCDLTINKCSPVGFM